MELESGIKISRINESAVHEALERLNEHLKVYNGEDIRKLKNEKYLIHERYFIDDTFFFTFKTMVQNQQIRLLCCQEKTKIVLVDYFIKKQRKVKYYDHFRKQAKKYCDRKKNL